jgi:tripartite-type tricarboxylate transporter receptor subunit TctC
MRRIFSPANSTVLACVLAATALYPVISAGQSTTQPLPKTITIVVPFEAGASNDIFARQLGQRLGTRIGSTVVVENRVGASGVIGTDYVSRAPADGSVLMITGSGFSSSAAVQPKLPYDPIKGFAPVAMLASGPHILAVSIDSPYKTLAQLLDAARASKGKVNYGSTGIGSTQHLNTARLNLLAGTEMTHIPFKGGASAVTSLIGGHIDLMLFSYPTHMPHVKSGKLRALAVTSASRSKFAPDLPTVSETIPGFTYVSWWGISAPAGTPQAVVDRLNAEIRAIVVLPEMREVFDKEGVDASEASTMTAAAFAAFVRSDLERWRDVARKQQIVAE